jgi:hypothetical protein
LQGPTALDRYGWAINAPIEDATVWRVLVTLTDYADESGLAWPRVDSLSQRIHRGDRTIRNALDTLEADGYLERVRLRSGGRLRGYLYRLLVPGARAVDPDILPSFATRDGFPDLPGSWAHPVPPSGSQLPVTSGNELPVGHWKPVTSQEPPTEEPTTEGTNTTTSALVPSTNGDDPEWDPEVVDLTREFATMVKANGHALPKRGTKAATGWLREVDRLRRLGPPGDNGDDPPPSDDEIRAVMTWALSVSDFWPANIRSAPKFREQYTMLRAQMARSQGSRKGGARTLGPSGDDLRAAAQALREAGR